MTQTTALAFPEENLVGWERALYAFLVEKQRRSGSLRTVQGYSSMLQDFFGRMGKAPDKVTVQEVFAWAHGKDVSGGTPPPSPLAHAWPVCHRSSASCKAWTSW